jgi:hypothetical protein
MRMDKNKKLLFQLIGDLIIFRQEELSFKVLLEA